MCQFSSLDSPGKCLRRIDHTIGYIFGFKQRLCLHLRSRLGCGRALLTTYWLSETQSGATYAQIDSSGLLETLYWQRDAQSEFQVRITSHKSIGCFLWATNFCSLSKNWLLSWLLSSVMVHDPLFAHFTHSTSRSLMDIPVHLESRDSVLFYHRNIGVTKKSSDKFGPEQYFDNDQQHCGSDRITCSHFTSPINALILSYVLYRQRFQPQRRVAY